MAKLVIQKAFGGPDVLSATDVPEPDPQALRAGQVLIRVSAAGVNPVDAQTRRGAGVAAMMGPLPFTVGWDLAGTVLAAGPGAELTAGRRVFGLAAFPQPAGAYGQYAVVPAAALVEIPDPISDVQAAALPLAALTAWQDLVDVAAVRAGQRVLIRG